MKLLLDTHIWIWSLAEPNRLSSRVHRELKDQTNELWLSPVSTWEALLLHSRGRIRLHGAARDWVTKATAHMHEAPLTHDIVVAAQELPLAHQDPADRFLVATADVLGLTLVTADHRLLGLGTIATLANR
ncbi:MAG TPA: type II toxin-antitoxin system VapC family toxin [Candidatus Baltobacteraceae bacterium]|nr:type II toxin-antitoxin system VapC family toxin [Candidatus Baltobacteraceae bacterium]